MEINSEYFYYKFIQHIAFDNGAREKLDNGKLDTFVFLPNTLDALYNFTFDSKETSCLSYDVKHNLIDLTSYIWNNKDKCSNVKESIEKVNESIHLLNSGTDNNFKKFILTQYYIRQDVPTVHILTDNRYKRIKKAVQRSIVVDFAIILTHAYEDNFEDNLDKFAESDYLWSMNALLKEQPELFTQKLFYDRVMMFLERMNENKKIADFKVKINNLNPIKP